MKKKILVLSLALAVALPVSASAKKKARPNTNNSNNASYEVTSISPTTAENLTENPITINGTGFLTITTAGAKLGAWEDDAKDTTDDSVLLDHVTVMSDTVIMAMLPAGAHAENSQDVTVFDTGVTPNTHFTLNDALSVHPSVQIGDEDGDSDGVVEVFQSSLSSSKTTFSLTVSGKSFKNKRWLKLKVGDKKAVITKVTRSGNDTVIRAKFKYGKMVSGLSDITLTYKDRMKKGVTRNNHVQYRTSWERGTITVDDAFSVLLQPVQ